MTAYISNDVADLLVEIATAVAEESCTCRFEDDLTDECFPHIVLGLLRPRPVIAWETPW